MAVTTQPLPAQVIERLGYIRFLHQEGIAQATRPHPMSSAAILSFHDAVELFYVLALDYKNVPVKPKSSFEDYWPALFNVVSNLSGRHGIQRLNTVRVALKHQGVIPGPQQVAAARTDVDAFLAANTQAVFSVDYDTVSMADVVPQQPVRSKVQAAAAAEAGGDRNDAMGLLAEAFDDLFKPQFYAYADKRSQLRVGATLRSDRLRRGEAGTILAWLRGDSKGGGYRDPRALGKQIEATTDVAAAAQAALRVMVIGIEYARYLRFEQLTPRIDAYMDNHIERSYPDGYDPTPDHFHYCQQFVIEVALRLAEVNADLELPPWLQQ